jgi:membrane protease YdiL (CAAX protease family)
MRWVALVVVTTAAAIAFALRHEHAGSFTMYGTIAAAYGALSALAVYKMWDDGTLVDRVAPRWGDLSIGVVVAAVLLLGSWAGRSLLAPASSPRHAWLLHIYLQLGDTKSIQSSVVLTALILLIPVFEELVWRGLVLDELTARLGTRRAWPVAAVLYALSVAPSIVTLADPIAGPNPLLFAAALGCGIFWSFLAAMTRRLPPVIVSHIAFTYFSIAQFRTPGF